MTVAGEVLSTRQMVDLEDLRRSEFFNEYLDLHGFHEGLRLSLWVGEREIQDVSLLRPWSAGAYGPAEVALGEALLPHLQRASAVARRLRHATLRYEIGATGPASANLAAFAFDRRGTLFWFNGAAEAVLASGEWLRLRSGELSASTPPVTCALHRAVSNAVGKSNTFSISTAVALPPSRTGAWRNIVVLPLSAPDDWSLSRPPAAIAFLRDPSTLALPEEILRRMFALTGAEIDLAGHIMAGRNLRVVAENSGRSPHTLRSHLAHLMAKTGTRRHADLLRLLTDLAALNSARRADDLSGFHSNLRTRNVVPQPTSVLKRG